VFAEKALIRDAVLTQKMPPWPAADCCASYKFDRSLDDTQIRTIVDWIDQGAVQGVLTSTVIVPAPTYGGLSRVDATLSMPEPYAPRPPPPLLFEQRCFLIDFPPEQKGRFVTGVNIRPGNQSIVHHVIAYVAGGDDAKAFRDLDNQDPRPGWDCTSGLGARALGAIGGWVPGSAGVDYPKGIGAKLAADVHMVLNIHYDISTGDSSIPDQTAIDLELDDHVDKEVSGAAVGNPLWLLGDGLAVNANDPDATFAYAYDPTGLYGGKSLTFYDAFIHMHRLGSRGTLAILRKDGTQECMLDVPRWDYNWGGELWFQEPKRLFPGDRLYVECHFDNTKAHNQAVFGASHPPRDLVWATDGEMCGGVFMITVDK
jgi:hypothetical protein